MRSPELVAKESVAEDKAGAPILRLVKSGVPRDLSPLEREFLPPLMEIQETPPSPVKRWILWSIVGLVVTLIIVATAPGKFIPDGNARFMVAGKTVCCDECEVRYALAALTLNTMSP